MFSSNFSQQQRQTLEIVEDFAEAKNLGNFRRIHIYHFSCFLSFFLSSLFVVLVFLVSLKA